MYTHEINKTKNEIEFKNFKVSCSLLYLSCCHFLARLTFPLMIPSLCPGVASSSLDEKHRCGGVLSPGGFNNPEIFPNHNLYRRCFLGILKGSCFFLRGFPSHQCVSEWAKLALRFRNLEIKCRNKIPWSSSRYEMEKNHCYFFSTVRWISLLLRLPKVKVASDGVHLSS